MLSLCWVDTQCLLYTSSPEIAGWEPDQFRLMLPLCWGDTLPPLFTSSPERQRGMRDITLTLALGRSLFLGELPHVGPVHSEHCGVLAEWPVSIFSSFLLSVCQKTTVRSRRHLLPDLRRVWTHPQMPTEAPWPLVCPRMPTEAPWSLFDPQIPREVPWPWASSCSEIRVRLTPIARQNTMYFLLEQSVLCPLIINSSKSW